MLIQKKTNLILYQIFTDKYIICIPNDYTNLEVPIALKYNKNFDYRIIVNLEIDKLKENLNNVFLNINTLEYYNYLCDCKNLIEFEKTLILTFDNITYNVNIHDFITALNNTILYIYNKFFFQINKNIK